MKVKTPHIHAIVIPKRWNEKRKVNTLQSCYYFNGIEKLRSLQDSYAETMQQNFPCLQRGIKGSRASHIRMATFYAVANKDVSDMSREELETVARKEEMLSMKAKFNDKTLKSFQYQTGKKDEKITELEQTILELLKENNELKKQISNEPQRVEKVERKRLKI